MHQQHSLQAFFDNQVVGMTEVSIDGRYLLANQQWCNMIGYSCDEITATDFQSITHPDDLPQQIILDRELQTGQRRSYRMEKRYICKDGSTLWCDLSVTGLYDDKDNLTGMVGLVIDISQQKAIANNLEKTEELQRTLLNASPDIICFKDGEGRWLLANDAILKLFRLEEVDYHGKTDAELAIHSPFYSSAFLTCEATDEQAWATRNISIAEEVIPTPEGENIILEVIKLPLFHPNGERKALVVIGRDVTLRKEHENRIAESEHRFHTLLDTMENIPIQGYDENRNVIYWNTASTKLYGYSQEEALGERLENLIIPETMKDEVIKGTQKYFQEGEQIPASKVILRNKAGGNVPVYSSHIMHTTLEGNKEMFCIDIDLQMLEQAEGQVRRLAKAVEQSGETIVITDTKGTIEYVNPAFTAVTGYTREEAVGQNPRILNSGKQDKDIYTDLWKTITKGKTWSGHFINQKKDGCLFTEDVSISPIFNPDGEITNYVAIKRDITEQLLTEEKYQQAQKMEAIGRLAGGIAHDFNNMLSIIFGQVEIALLKTSQEDPLRKRFKEIKTAATRSAQLTQQLLGFARKQSRDAKILNINDTVSAMLTMLKSLIGENLELHWSPQSKNPFIHIDPTHLDQILTNLIINSKDSISGTGNIIVSTSDQFLDGYFCSHHRGCKIGHYVCLTVTDTGCGMSEEVLEKIFEPFFTTKEVGKGTGLGLSMVIGLIKQNNGYIVAESLPGEGSTFNLYFPQNVTEEHEIEISFESKGIITGSETILVVEDENALLTSIKNMLEGAGYNVLTAQGPFAAIQLVEKYKETIDLVLTDIVMPKMDGVELSEHLKKVKHGIKVLYMSGYPRDHLRNKDTLNTSAKMLTKPFTMHQLTQTVREVLDAENGAPIQD